MEKPSVLADLVTLTKPRIISLLLVTTVAPMFMTDRGLPSPILVVWVVLGGYLMAGGANAINMWFDRDIDDRMTRTRLRPIPAGRITPAPGLALRRGARRASRSASSGTRCNPLSAWLALGGLLFYVFIYTMLLKRNTAQNIVIGGAAGAFPPLVGWAAMTGRLDLAAIYLFAIIFYWTPPHFWALALIKQGEYAKAGRPDDAGGEGRGAHQVGDAGLHPDAAAPHHHAGGVRRARPVLRGGGRAARRAGFSGTASRCCARPGSRRRRGRCTAIPCSTCSCSSWPWASTATCRAPRARRAPEVVILRQNDEAATQAARSPRDWSCRWRGRARRAAN